MAGRRLRLVLVVASGLVVIAGVSACGGGGSSSSSTTSAVAAAEQPAPSAQEGAPAPAQEGTGPEQPQAQQNQPSVQLASLPVGGSTDLKQSPECVPVGWSGTPLGDGVKFRIVKVVVDGDFKAVDGGGCQDPCEDHQFVSGGGSCQANVAWVRSNNAGTLSGTLGLVGQCIAPDAATCAHAESVAEGEAQTQHVTLSAQALSSDDSASSAGDSSSASQG
jgi:hypothetical protein